jgi:hypothetical protein
VYDECEYRWGLDWRVHLLTTSTHDSWLHLITVPLLPSTIYKFLPHMLRLFSLLSLHQSLPDNDIYQWRFFSFRAHFIACLLSTVTTKSSLHRLPYSSLSELLLQLSSIHCCTPTVSMGTCLFAKVLLSNGCIYLLIKNLLLRSRRYFVACFKVVTQ